MTMSGVVLKGYRLLLEAKELVIRLEGVGPQEQAKLAAEWREQVR
jgi:hypothetical protein